MLTQFPLTQEGDETVLQLSDIRLSKNRVHAIVTLLRVVKCYTSFLHNMQQVARKKNSAVLTLTYCWCRFLASSCITSVSDVIPLMAKHSVGVGAETTRFLWTPRSKEVSTKRKWCGVEKSH